MGAIEIAGPAALGKLPVVLGVTLLPGPVYLREPPVPMAPSDSNSQLTGDAGNVTS